MSPYLESLKRISRECDCAVFLIADCGKDRAKGMRGWSGIRAAVDVELEVTRDPLNDQRRVTVSKLKGGADGHSYAFKLEPIALAFYADG